MEVLKEKRRQEKMAKVLKERERQRFIENQRKAVEFSRRLLLRRIGMEGFKRLLQRKREKIWSRARSSDAGYSKRTPSVRGTAMRPIGSARR